jgi:citrate lyase subunit beta/citryl-CoA lyase
MGDGGRIMERLRRTMLFLPGGNQRFLTKGLGLAVDSLILDLEDSVTPENKASAREAVAEALTSSHFGDKEKVVRVNSLATDYGKSDIAAVTNARPDALLVPKVNRPEDVVAYDALIAEAEKNANLPPGGIGLMAMIETPLGVVNIDAIASACPRMRSLIFGAADYTRETRGRISPGRPELYYPMIRILLGARVAGIDAIDTPYFDIKDAEGLRRHTQQAKDMGYDGKTIIHPSQIDIVNQIFTPSTEEVTYARRVIEAFDKARAAGRGATQLDGQMIENVHLDMAQRTLRIADKAGLTDKI